MMWDVNRVPFGIDEWYHCYSRGIDKRTTFDSETDAERFLQLLYLSNSSDAIHLSNLTNRSTDAIVTHRRGDMLVSLGAYCLMPNHFHLLLKEITDGGIARFMQKLGTAYTMYFNQKNRRIGNLFVKPFRSRHIGDDRYFQRVVNYIHCNPAESFEPGWKKGIVKNMDRLETRLLQYRYSSFADFAGKRRPIAAILSSGAFDTHERTPPKRMLADARAYYADISMDDPGLILMERSVLRFLKPSRSSR